MSSNVPLFWKIINALNVKNDLQFEIERIGEKNLSWVYDQSKIILTGWDDFMLGNVSNA